MGFWDAVASDGPRANNLHLAQDRQPRQHLITQFLQAGCSSSCRPTNSVKALKAHAHHNTAMFPLAYRDTFMRNTRCRRQRLGCSNTQSDAGQSPTLARPAVPLAACIQRDPCTTTDKGR